MNNQQRIHDFCGKVMRTPQPKREALAQSSMDRAQEPLHEEGTEHERQAYLKELARLAEVVSSDLNEVVNTYWKTDESSPAKDDRHPHKTHITEADYR